MVWPKFFRTFVGACLIVEAVQSEPQGEATRRLPSLTLPEVEPKPIGPSRVPFVLAIELDWAKAAIAEAIPELLYEATDREVAPGIRIDAKIRRGPIELRARDYEAKGIVPVRVDLSARSRLGKMVLDLGRCQTSVDITLDARLKFARDGALPPPTASATLLAPCRLSGFDVTPMLKYEIEQRLAAAQDELRNQHGRANAQLKQIQRNVRQHLAQAAVGCHRFVPSKLLQLPISIDNGIAVSKFVAIGDLTQDCRGALEQDLVIEAAPDPGHLETVWVSRISIAELREIIEKRLIERTSAGNVTSARAVVLDGIDQLAFYLELTKARGWVFARPTVVGHTLTLRAVTAQREELRQALAPVLESITIPIDTATAESLTRQMVTAANELVQGFGFTSDWKTRYTTQESDLSTIVEALVDRDVVAVVIRRRSS